MEHILKSRYKIGQQLSENPFSATYRGSFIGNDRPVIVKIYKRGTLNSALIKSMKQRVKDFTLLGHHGLVKLLDGDYGWQGFYYVREFVEGRSLRQLQAAGEQFDEEKVRELAEQVLLTLQEVHRRGVIHGALKPTNIFIDKQGLVKLTDFVIEGEIKNSWPQKAEELFTGNPYASPEELKGEPLTPASDLYSLVLIMRELLGGGSPAGGGVKAALTRLRVNETVGDLTISYYLKEIINKGLAAEPRRRFLSAAALRTCLEKRSLIESPHPREEYLKIFDSTVTQYGGDELNEESPALEDVGRIRLRWEKEKHRNWLLGLIVMASVLLGIVYAFLFGR